MSPRIQQALLDLYGPTAGANAAAELGRLLDSWRPRIPGPAARQAPLTARDALLITYADQVREPGLPPLQALNAFAARHLEGVVSGIHLLPFYPWTSDDGFSVQNYHAVDPGLGTWDDIRRLGTRFDLMFDAVFNHLSARSEWFERFLAGDPEFRDFFVTVEGAPDLSRVVRPRALPLLTNFESVTGPRRVWTTFSADQVDLNFQNPAVLVRLVDVLLAYVAQGARFVRLDAIAFLWKEVGTTCLHLPQTHRVIQFFRAVLDAVAPGVRLITETNVPHADNVSYFGDGTNEAQLVYNFALPPLVLHSFATANAEALTRWAGTLTLPSDQVTFFNFLASHDGIGLNPVRGILPDSAIDALVDRTRHHGGFISCKHLPDGSQAPYEMNINYLDALVPPGGPDAGAVRCFVTAHAILLSLPGVPGLYFHSLFGSRGDRAGAEASGIPRRINRQKLDRAALDRDLATPGSVRAGVFGALRDLLRRRAANPAFAPQSPAEVLALDPRVLALRRHDPEGRGVVLCLHNVSADTVRLARPAGASADVVLPPHGFTWVERP